MLTLACSSCQMTQLMLAFPAFFQMIWCLVPAFVAYLIAIGKEGAPTSRKAKLTMFFVLAFFAGLAILPVLVFPIMLLVLPLFLLTKLGSKQVSARVAAGLGLLPFVFVLGRAQWLQSQQGPYYKLDHVYLPSHYARNLRNDPFPDLSLEQFLEALTNGPKLRRQNAAIMLQRPAHTNASAEELQAFLDDIKRRVGDSKEEHVTELVRVLERAIEGKKARALEAEPTPRPSPPGGAEPVTNQRG